MQSHSYFALIDNLVVAESTSRLDFCLDIVCFSEQTSRVRVHFCSMLTDPMLGQNLALMFLYLVYSVFVFGILFILSISCFKKLYFTYSALYWCFLFLKDIKHLLISLPLMPTSLHIAPLCTSILLCFALLYILPLYHKHSALYLHIALFHTLSSLLVHSITVLISLYCSTLLPSSSTFNTCLLLILLSLHCSTPTSSAVKSQQSRIMLDSRR